MGPDQYRPLQFDNTVEGGDPAANDVSAFGGSQEELRTLDNYILGDNREESDTDSE